MFRFIFFKIDDIFLGSAIPEVRGTAESYGGAGHFRSLLPYTLTILIITSLRSADGRAETDRSD